MGRPVAGSWSSYITSITSPLRVPASSTSSQRWMFHSAGKLAKAAGAKFPFGSRTIALNVAEAGGVTVKLGWVRPYAYAIVTRSASY
jgi:hypothetical protein